MKNKEFLSKSDKKSFIIIALSAMIPFMVCSYYGVSFVIKLIVTSLLGILGFAFSWYLNNNKTSK
ncbi:hypothetical protein [Brumimicrobium mesophilum]|uniref:hypothetical protein n=1 Tax=Brumimicrobium mesophilum TaxID=392717 RepID=UPI000D141454|nr:hypothetical protein [Brumimicrobium mesophilum]